jgi:hypothetical protein
MAANWDIKHCNRMAANWDIAVAAQRHLACTLHRLLARTSVRMCTHALECARARGCGCARGCAHARPAFPSPPCATPLATLHLHHCASSPALRSIPPGPCHTRRTPSDQRCTPPVPCYTRCNPICPIKYPFHLTCPTVYTSHLTCPT